MLLVKVRALFYFGLLIMDILRLNSLLFFPFILIESFSIRPIGIAINPIQNTVIPTIAIAKLEGKSGMCGGYRIISLVLAAKSITKDITDKLYTNQPTPDQKQ
jgi:hypothetical protein